MAETFSISSDYSAWWLANCLSSEVSIMQVFLPGKLSSKSLAKVSSGYRSKSQRSRENPAMHLLRKKKMNAREIFFSLSDFSFTFSKAP